MKPRKWQSNRYWFIIFWPGFECHLCKQRPARHYSIIRHKVTHQQLCKDCYVNRREQP